eukprot:CAMPEP_0118665714 /NCGR_PEP_ID=MMETSP0785-20121206/18782_1 /TAXON_ID=91992 /ORGANISM="Bolidomonas pacifica, Strain CCMP 1866" /LENGTH=196 /DNA_ID=CAMNT_0006559883 /DNA_START=442 /DNA_END=1028 /DNA_ORIENTATION=+
MTIAMLESTFSPSPPLSPTLSPYTFLPPPYPPSLPTPLHTLTESKSTLLLTLKHILTQPNSQPPKPKTKTSNPSFLRLELPLSLDSIPTPNSQNGKSHVPWFSIQPTRTFMFRSMSSTSSSPPSASYGFGSCYTLKSDGIDLEAVESLPEGTRAFVAKGFYDRSEGFGSGFEGDGVWDDFGGSVVIVPSFDVVVDG